MRNFVARREGLVVALKGFPNASSIHNIGNRTLRNVFGKFGSIHLLQTIYVNGHDGGKQVLITYYSKQGVESALRASKLEANPLHPFGELYGRISVSLPTDQLWEYYAEPFDIYLKNQPKQDSSMKLNGVECNTSLDSPLIQPPLASSTASEQGNMLMHEAKFEVSIEPVIRQGGSSSEASNVEPETHSRHIHLENMNANLKQQLETSQQQAAQLEKEINLARNRLEESLNESNQLKNTVTVLQQALHYTEATLKKLQSNHKPRRDEPLAINTTDAEHVSKIIAFEASSGDYQKQIEEIEILRVEKEVSRQKIEQQETQILQLQTELELQRKRADMLEAKAHAQQLLSPELFRAFEIVQQIINQEDKRQKV